MRFTVEKTKLPTQYGGAIDRWFVMDKGIPLYEVNAWLDEKSLQSINTGRKYAGIITKFINFLDMRSVKIEDATKKDVVDYLKYLIYGISNDLSVLSIESNITYSTLRSHVTVITNFYQWLEAYAKGTNMSLLNKRSRSRTTKSFLYGQIWNNDYTELLDRHVLELRASREYIKWYSNKEKTALLSNFLTLRDKAIFLVTLEGMRIDEALSIRMIDYNKVERVVQPSRSKGRTNVQGFNNHLRPVVLPQSTCDILDRYIYTERADAETEAGKLSEWLFINLRKGEGQAEVLKYHNFNKILKQCAMRAGMNASKIRTHSGRSTKTMELIEHQIMYPEDNYTDEMIRQTMGWNSLDSINPYKNYNSIKLAKASADKIHSKRGRLIEN